MSVSKLLLWEKWRPENLDDIILLPRIKNHFKDGVNGNYIFYGNFGTGKTSLARILIGKYTKDKPYLEINSSLYTSIDVLRNDIENFCRYRPMIESDSEIKYVFLDEFDGVSTQFQDAFKAFIEKYSKNGVRFIITTNHLNKIRDGIKSRITQINFSAQNVKEEKFLKQEIYKKIYSNIIPSEGKEISKNDLVKIINKNFPDFRATLVDVQNYLNTGSSTSSVSSDLNTLKLKLYKTIYDENLNYEEIYKFIMSSFGADNIENMFNLLGRPFIDWSLSNDKNIEKLFECNYIISDYADKLDSNTDPIILGLTVIGKLRDTLL